MSQRVVWKQGDPDVQLEHGGQYTFCFDLKPIGGVGNYWLNIDPKIAGLFGNGGYFNVKLLGGDLDIWAPTTEVTDGHEWLLVDVDSYSPQLLIALALVATIIGLGIYLAREVRQVIVASGAGDILKGIGDALKNAAQGGWLTPVIIVAAVVALVLLLPAMVGSGKKAIKGLS